MAIRELRSRSEQFASGTLPFDQLLKALSWYSFDDENEGDGERLPKTSRGSQQTNHGLASRSHA